MNLLGAGHDSRTWWGRGVVAQTFHTCSTGLGGAQPPGQPAHIGACRAVHNCRHLQHPACMAVPATAMAALPGAPGAAGSAGLGSSSSRLGGAGPPAAAAVCQGVPPGGGCCPAACAPPVLGKVRQLGIHVDCKHHSFIHVCVVSTAVASMLAGGCLPASADKCKYHSLLFIKNYQCCAQMTGRMATNRQPAEADLGSPCEPIQSYQHPPS